MEEKIIFISEKHKNFYYEKLKEVREQDVYHKALCYCLGINNDTREHINRIYDFKTGLVKPECLHDGCRPAEALRLFVWHLTCIAMELLV